MNVQVIILNVPTNLSAFSLFISTDLYVTPADHTGPYGQDFKFECIAKASTAPAPTLTWTFNNDPIANVEGEYLLMHMSDDKETTSTLTILNAQEDDNGKYVCSSPSHSALGTFEGNLDAYQNYGNEVNLCCFLSCLNNVLEEPFFFWFVFMKFLFTCTWVQWGERKYTFIIEPPDPITLSK